MNCVFLMDLKEKIMNLNYYFSSRQVRKKLSVSSSSQYIFVVLGYLTDLRLTLAWFLMISGNPSSKCQIVWLQIRPTFDTSICTELKGLIS